ncbi:MAG TPA: hypothetical protein VEW46_20540 [Pyrinomonadaceae bacterium]|nr:hypothetical protein [Pyrinomonadaceae bacterium]
MKQSSFSNTVIQLALRTGLIAAFVAVGWAIYSQLPHQPTTEPEAANGETVLQIVLRPSLTREAEVLDIPVELYPVDIVSVRDEYFTERRAGKRFDDFLSERMKGRNPVTAKLDRQGQTSVVINPGNWWLHALLSGDEELEWRLPIKVSGRKQTVELTSQNVYARTRSF